MAGGPFLGALNMRERLYAALGEMLKLVHLVALFQRAIAIRIILLTLLIVMLRLQLTLVDPVTFLLLSFCNFLLLLLLSLFLGCTPCTA